MTGTVLGRSEIQFALDVRKNKTVTSALVKTNVDALRRSIYRIDSIEFWGTPKDRYCIPARCDQSLIKQLALSFKWQIRDLMPIRWQIIQIHCQQ
jgi:hypothetical protein